MEVSIQAFVTISVFAALHERMLELLRGLRKPHWAWLQRVVDALTVGPYAVLTGIALAIATRANLLALFEYDTGKTTSKFFEVYLDYSTGLLPPVGAWRHVMGCVLMGGAAGLGSKFWHDLAYGLADLRDRAKALPKAAARLAAPPDTPPSAFVSPAKK